MRKLIYCVGCPGDVYFYVYKKIEEGWLLEYRSTTYSYGYDPSVDYKMRQVSNSVFQEMLFAEDMESYDFSRRPFSTGFDNYMIYWVLEGKKVQDYAGWTSRVKVVSEDDEFIDLFIKNHKPCSI